MLVATLAGCGGKVVFTEGEGGSGGEGGAGGATTTVGTSSATNASASTGDNCFALGEALDEAVAAAIACDPQVNTLECSGKELLFDRCGCQGTVANDSTPQLAQAARDAFDAWVAGGCGPFECGACNVPVSGGCDAGQSTCVGYFPD
jgi:hypothetical protein